MVNEQNEKSKVLDFDLSKLKGVEGVDLNEFNMIDTEIENVELKSNTKTINGKIEENIFLEITSKQLHDTKNIRARTFISMWKDEESGSLAYSTSPNSNATKILNFFKVDSFDKLKGLACKTIKRVNDSGKEKLDIYFGQ